MMWAPRAKTTVVGRMIERITGGDMAAKVLLVEGIVNRRFDPSEDVGPMVMRTLKSPSTGREVSPPAHGHTQRSNPKMRTPAPTMRLPTHSRGVGRSWRSRAKGMRGLPVQLT
jgi:hypothetical protein